MNGMTKLLASTCVAVSLTGCGGMSLRDRDTLIGAGIRTAAGAAIGGNVGGAVVGGVVGGVIGHEVSKH